MPIWQTMWIFNPFRWNFQILLKCLKLKRDSLVTVKLEMVGAVLKWVAANADLTGAHAIEP